MCFFFVFFFPLSLFLFNKMITILLIISTMWAQVAMNASGLINAAVKYMLHTCLSVCDRLTAWSGVLSSFMFPRCLEATEVSLTPVPEGTASPAPCQNNLPRSPSQGPPDSPLTTSTYTTPDLGRLFFSFFFFFLRAVILPSASAPITFQAPSVLSIGLINASFVRCGRLSGYLVINDTR